MDNPEAFFFSNRDRVSHHVRGLGTVRCNPQDDDLVVDDDVTFLSEGVRWVYVIWDDDRYPVDKIACTELEKLSDAAAAISTGF